LLLSDSLYAKDKSLADYPLSFTVSFSGQGTLHSQGSMTLKSNNGLNYFVHPAGFCGVFNGGAVAHGKRTSIWGQRQIELA
jgi:hypothetical protein